MILAVCFQLKQLKKQPEKNSGLIRTHDLAISVQPAFFQVAFLTAYIESTLRGSQFQSCLSAVHIYDFHIFVFKFIMDMAKQKKKNKKKNKKQKTTKKRMRSKRKMFSSS